MFKECAKTLSPGLRRRRLQVPGFFKRKFNNLFFLINK
jgi:hypothetical protein